VGVGRQRLSPEGQTLGAMVAATGRTREHSQQAARGSGPGCLLGRGAALLARVVLAAAPAIMAAQTGQWLAALAGWGETGAWALALLGLAAGAALGLGLIVRGMRHDGGRALRADLALVLLACVFLARAVLGHFQALPLQDVGLAYLAALAAALVVWLLG